MRYIIALVVAVLIIGIGFAFVRHTRHSFQLKLQAAVEENKKSAALAGKEQVEVDPSEYGLEMSTEEHRRFDIANFLVSFRYILIPFTLLACIAVAYILGRTGT